jgi:hypothetical protein
MGRFGLNHSYVDSANNPFQAILTKIKLLKGLYAPCSHLIGNPYLVAGRANGQRFGA